MRRVTHELNKEPAEEGSCALNDLPHSAGVCAIPWRWIMLGRAQRRPISWVRRQSCNSIETELRVRQFPLGSARSPNGNSHRYRSSTSGRIFTVTRSTAARDFYHRPPGRHFLSLQRTPRTFPPARSVAEARRTRGGVHAIHDLPIRLTRAQLPGTHTTERIHAGTGSFA